jgi:accessory colonization factor AcfC
MTPPIIDIAIYAEHSIMAGLVCLDPENKYGDDWKDNADLQIFSGTRSELLATAATLTASPNTYLRKAGRSITSYLA